jgi:hypothetical protein
MFLKNNGTIVMASSGTIYTTGVPNLPPSNGFRCTTCHNAAEWPALYTVAEVTFPSGAKVTFGGYDADGKPVADPNNICLLCHQGRSSTKTVNAIVAGKDPNTVDAKISFSNVHYFAAGATLFGSDVMGAYQYAEKDYVGFNAKHPINKCGDCHEVHALEVKTEACTTCHAGVEDLEAVRMDATDWDGDGDTTEGVKAEIASFEERLYADIQAYAKANSVPIVYDSSSYPYWFVDADENGEADLNDKGGKVSYNGNFTPILLEACYNYQYSHKDPGAFTHNPKYVLQFLYDSIESLGGDLTGLTRPVTPAAE